MEWSDALSLKLIEAIREKRVLWDPRDPQKKSKNARNDAVNAIASTFNTSASEVTRKWKNLIQSYRVYRRRCRTTTTGMGANEVYKPTWFAYYALDDFMNDVYVPQTTIDTMYEGKDKVDAEEEDSEYHDAEELEDDPSPIESVVTNEENSVITPTDEGNPDINASTSKKAVGHGKSPMKKQFKSPKKVSPSPKKPLKRKYSEERSEDPRVAVAYDYLISRKQKEDSALSKKVKDECDIFGEFIASKLKKEDAETRELMMHEMHKVIFDIKRGKTSGRSSLTSLQTQQLTQRSSSAHSFLGMHSPELFNYPSPSATSPNFSSSVSPISSHSYSDSPSPLSSIYSLYPLTSGLANSEPVTSPDD